MLFRIDLLSEQCQIFLCFVPMLFLIGLNRFWAIGLHMLRFVPMLFLIGLNHSNNTQNAHNCFVPMLFLIGLNPQT